MTMDKPFEEFNKLMEEASRPTQEFNRIMEDVSKAQKIMEEASRTMRDFNKLMEEASKTRKIVEETREVREIIEEVRKVSEGLNNHIVLGCPNRLSSVDRFLYSRCQSRPSCAWWRNVFKEAKPTQRPQWGSMLPSTTI